MELSTQAFITFSVVTVASFLAEYYLYKTDTQAYSTRDYKDSVYWTVGDSAFIGILIYSFLTLISGDDYQACMAQIAGAALAYCFKVLFIKEILDFFIKD